MMDENTKEIIVRWIWTGFPTTNDKKILHGFGPLANYADRATAASWRSSTNFCG
jgi:hypothetical protein